MTWPRQAATVITLIFILEMGLKLLALGCAAYWADGWNRLDGTIVILSMIDLSLELWVALAGSSGSEAPSLSFLRILRMLRVLRMLRLMRSWKGLYKIIITLVSSIPQARGLAHLLRTTPSRLLWLLRSCIPQPASRQCRASST